MTLFGRWELSFHDMELSGQVWCLMRVRLVLAHAYSKSKQFKWTSWTQLSLAKVWSLIHHFQYPMDKNPSLLPSTRICSLVFFFFFKSTQLLSSEKWQWNHWLKCLEFIFGTLSTKTKQYHVVKQVLQEYTWKLIFNFSVFLGRNR